METSNIASQIGALNTLSFTSPGVMLIAIPVILLMIMLLWKHFIPFKDKEERIAYENHTRGTRILMGISRIILILLIFASLAGPHIFYERHVLDEAKAVIALDTSSSMENYNRAMINELIRNIQEEVDAEIYAFNISDWERIRPAVKQNTPMLIVSDGMLAGDSLRIASLASTMNSTINAVSLTPSSHDFSVSLDVPPISAAGVDVPITISVHANELAKGMDHEVILTVDGVEMANRKGQGSQEYTILFRPDQGQKVITARLTGDDFFEQNNEDTKILTVSEKPSVLLVSSKSPSPLSFTLSTLYNLTMVSTLSGYDNERLSNYYAIILDDQPMQRIRTHQNAISDYVIDGNGLVVVGGKQSFEFGGYKDTVLEKILPVRVGDAEATGPSVTNVALVIDISGSTGEVFSEGSVQSVQDVIKNLAVGVLRTLRPNDQVTVIAFNRDYYMIADLAQVSTQSGLEGRILRLEFMGGTSLATGMNRAINEIARAQGAKYVILFSDGISDTGRADELSAISMKNGGITLYTVGVGDLTDVQHMRKLAQITGGTFFQPGEQDKFKILFGTDDSRPQEQERPTEIRQYHLSAWDEHHFISRELRMTSFTAGFNKVIPRQSARTLVVTEQNNPIVTAGFFGLGRIVAMSTDNGQEWAGNIYEKNPELIARSVNYAIGDVGEREELYITTTGREGRPAEISIFSKSQIPLNITVSNNTLQFQEQRYGLYTAIAELERGVHTILGKKIAIGYSEEYSYNTRTISDAAAATGGSMFELNEHERIIEKIRQDSRRTEQSSESAAHFFLLLAGIIFLIDVSWRRLTENRGGA
jgi:uncharacterized membrane protein/predicted small integral membrane protein